MGPDACVSVCVRSAAETESNASESDSEEESEGVNFIHFLNNSNSDNKK